MIARDPLSPPPNSPAADPPTSTLSDLKVVLGHDYLLQMGGAERVVASMHRTFPEARIFVSATDYKRLLPDFDAAELRETWMHWIPFIDRHYKKFFPLYPFAFKALGWIDADIALVSSSGFAKWLRFTHRTNVFCYCHTPPRFLWQPDSYLHREIHNRLFRKLVRLMIPPFRRWDYRAAQQVDHFIANSRCVQDRIRQCYNRDSTVIYPPVEIDRFEVQTQHEGYYLVVSRLVAYKSIDRAVLAFTASGKRLVIVGDGPDRQRLEGMAGPNVEFKGRTSDDEVKRYLEYCYAVVSPGLEDFGITPVEAQACGKPVLAFAGGGALETITDGVTGLFFSETDPASLNAVIDQFEQVAWNAFAIRANAERFSEVVFIRELRSFLQSKLALDPDT